MARTAAQPRVDTALRASALSSVGVVRRFLPRAQVWVILIGGLVLWTLSLDDINVLAITDIGLASQAQPMTIAGMALVALGFTLSLRLRPFSVVAALVATALMIVMIHGLPAFLEDAPRFATAYLHSGFTGTIAEDGRLLTRVDARFNWPLFFSLGALVTQIAGIGNAIALQPWAAVVSELLYLGPLFMIFSSLTADRRHVWLAICFFYGANWIGQDYYSPQSFNFLIYLSVLAILLRWFRRTTVPGWIAAVVSFVDRRLPWFRAPMRSGPVAAAPAVAYATPQQRTALVAVIVLLCAVSVASHQLTPFALLGATAALVVVGRTQLRGLPVLIAVMIGLWISYMTVAFLAGHLVGLLSELGAPHEAAEAGVARRLQGSAAHVFIVQFRLLMTLAFWVLAAAGAVRRLRNGHLDLEALALAATPFALLLLQAYGGELVLRIYLFSMPFMAFLAAGLFFPTVRPMSWRTTFAGVAAVAVLLIALLVAKHGNERADMITADELAAIDKLYTTAPQGSLFAAVHTWGALRYRDFTDFRYSQVPEAFLGEDLELMALDLDSDAPCTYLVITRSQQAATELYWGYTSSEWRHAESVVRESGQFVEVYSSRDARILTVAPAPAECTEGWQ